LQDRAKNKYARIPATRRNAQNFQTGTCRRGLAESAQFALTDPLSNAAAWPRTAPEGNDNFLNASSRFFGT
jgi:hypothetical protein